MARGGEAGSTTALGIGSACKETNEHGENGGDNGYNDDENKHNRNLTLKTYGLELNESQLLSLATPLRSCVLNLNGSGIVGALAAALGTFNKTSRRHAAGARDTPHHGLINASGNGQRLELKAGFLPQPAGGARARVGTCSAGLN